MPITRLGVYVSASVILASLFAGAGTASATDPKAKWCEGNQDRRLSRRTAGRRLR